jgi:aminoglycoside phosphotransferase
MITSDVVWHQVGFGCSGAVVYRLDRPPALDPWAYLKVAPASSLAADAAAMQWLNRGGVATARVLHYDSSSTCDVMLMSPLMGVTGIDPLALARPHALTTHLALALCALHDNTRPMPSAETDGGFDMRLAARLAAKERAAHAGTFDPERVTAIKRHLANAPADVERDLVFTHGDYCLPNVVFRCASPDDVDDVDTALAVVGLIDVGGAGVADPHRDLASAVWSLRFNGLGDRVEQFLRIYASSRRGFIVDHAKLDWYIVMKLT